MSRKDRTVSRATPSETKLPLDLGELGQAVLDTMPDACVIADASGEIVYANPAYARVCYRDVRQLVGDNIFRNNPEGALAQALRSGQPVLGKKYRVYGGPVEIVSHAFPLFRHGLMVGGVAFFREMSPALELLGDLEREQRMVRLLQARLEAVGRTGPTFEDLVGASAAMVHVLTVARRAALSNAPVLLQGEVGTGKTSLARAIHNASRRRKEAFLTVPCSSLAPEDLEEMLCGGAEANGRFGLLELAGGGTIFLDQVAALPAAAQLRLLEALRRQKQRAEGPAIIAATNGRLEEMVAAGRFHAELYRYLQAVTIDIPPLRERPEDLPVLAENLLARASRSLGKAVAGIDREVLAVFRTYSWPGNVRELANVLERAVILVEEGGWITTNHVFLPRDLTGAPEELILPLEEMEQIMIARALRKYGTTVAGKREAAKALNISLTTLYNKLRRGGAQGFPPHRSARSERA